MAAKSRTRRAALLGAVLGLVACMGAAERPRPSGPPLAPDLGERARAAAGKFRVVFAGPKGEASAGSEISVVFDRPLRALDRADAPVPQLLLNPAIPGSVRWVGARALVFDAKGGLPPATEIVIEVPKSVKALDGSELGETYRYAFTTPRPRLVESWPSMGESNVLPTQKLALGFNQRVPVKSLERWGRLRVAGRELPFSVEAPRSEAPQRLVVVPKDRLQLNADVSFILAPELVGEEGPLPAGSEQKLDFHTLRPLRVEGVECNRDSPNGRCMPGFGVGLSFTNPVRTRELGQLVTITPRPPGRFPSEPGDDSYTGYLELPASMAAGKSYSVRVAAGLVDMHGQRLANDFVTTVVMDDLYPRVAIGIGDGSVVPADRGPIPVQAVNAPGAEVVYAALQPNDVLGPSPDAEAFEKLVSGRPSAKRFQFVRGERNRPVRGVLDPKDALGPAALGVLGLVADYPQEERDGDRPPSVRLAKLSDLALSAKLSRHGSQLWVTRLSTAEPVAGAKVELVPGRGARRSYVSDAAGFVRIPGGDFAPDLEHSSKDRDAVLLVSAGNEWTFERLSDVVEPWSLPVPTDPSGELHVEGLLFSDRDLYRPGDTVRVKGVVRRQTVRGTGIPVGEKVVLKLRSPDDDDLQTRELTVSRFGTFAAELSVPRSAGLGSYLVRAKLGRDEIDLRVGVEEYRAAEFKVDVSAPSTALRGDKIAGVIHGTYLFGADMSGADARYRWIRTPASYAPPASEGYATDASVYYSDLDHAGFDRGETGAGEAKLDAGGALAAPADLVLSDQRGPESLVLDAEVTDIARRSGSGRTQVLVHPGEFYLGLAEPAQLFVDAPARIEPKLVALTPDGQKLSGKRVRLELVARRWTFAREDRGGIYPDAISKVVDQVLASCELTTTAPAAASCALPIKEAGYYIVLARAEDARKNPIRAAHSLYALGSAEAGFRVEDNDSVELVPDKTSYRVGETAKILVKSPFAKAEAWVSVERADVLKSERKSLVGSTPTLSVPITEDMRPNAFVSVALFRPLGKNAAVVPGGAFRIGYAQLTVEPESRRLAVEVVPSAQKLEPGDKLSVEVRVRDSEKRPAPAEVTLYAVDEGVLLLSGYQIPDPVEVFSRPRPLGVSTLDTRTNIAKVGRLALEGQLGLGKGAEAGGGGDSVRRDFRATAYFNPGLVTDASGVARAEFLLPDGLTSYRVMAVAVGNADRFGAGSASITTSRPLMARPALPRLLRAGDELEAGVIVSAREVDPGPVEVKARAEGLTLVGPDTKLVTPGRNGQVEVRFPVRTAGAGQAKLRFEVRGKALGRDAVETKLPVKAPVEFETVALAGSTQNVAAEALGDLKGVRADVGELEVSVAASALVGLDAGATQLLEYPYECSEQLASRLVPLGALASLSSDFGLPEAARRGELGALAAQKLSARQQGDGGFSMWGEGGPSRPWISAYALWALHEAKQRGIDVSPRVLERGQRYLRAVLAQYVDEPYWLASAAYALDVLAELGAADSGYMSRLFEARAKLPLFARALLLHAFAVSKAQGKERAVLLAELEAQIRLTGADAKVVDNLGSDYAALFDSETRTQAMVLRALLANQPQHPLATPLARGLMSARRGGTWRSTQETAFALLALDTYRRVAEAENPDFTAKISLGERVLLSHEFRGRTLKAANTQLGMAALQAGKGAVLGFEVDGSGSLYYEARLRYARSEPPRVPFDAGFFVEKALFETSALELAGAPASKEAPRAAGLSFPAGALIRAQITVVSPEPRDFVVVDDPLPAGFEAINARFATTSDLYSLRGPDCEERGAVRDQQDPRCVTSERREFRDDRVLFFFDHLPPGVYRLEYFARASGIGRFVVPATRAEAMYAPEIFGRTAASRVEVK